MKLNKIITAGMLAIAIGSPVMADTMSADQKKEVEKLVHDYLVNNPEVLIEVSQALQQKQQQDMQKQAKGAILENSNALLEGKLSVAGNPNGNVTLIEFFDYQCIHCKKMAPVIDTLIKQDSNLRVIYKEFPIFGKTSELASQVALAAAMQGKYTQFHNALLKVEKHLDEKIIMETAKAAGLDMAKLQKDMKSSAVTQALEANTKLAEKLHLMGTPAFVIVSTPGGHLNTNSEPTFIPGAASQEALQDIIKKMQP